jgi:hypothetical protein
LGHADDGGVVAVMAEVLEQGGDGVLLAECHLDLRVLVVERREERPGRCGDTRDRPHADASADDAAEAVERVAAGIDGRRWVDGCVGWKVCHLDHEVLALGRGDELDASHRSCQLEAGEHHRADAVPPSERFQVAHTDLSASDAVAEARNAVVTPTPGRRRRRLAG